MYAQCVIERIRIIYCLQRRSNAWDSECTGIDIDINLYILFVRVIK